MQAKVSAKLMREKNQEEIYQKIYTAILEHRLPPGTKLVEERLAEIMKVSRARIRDVLARLAHEQVVNLIPQRGAYVAKPTPEQATQIFEARRLLEPYLLRSLIGNLTPDKLERLRQHQALEGEARRRQDKRAIVRLSGEFHTLISELAGNEPLATTMRKLSTLTCLIIFLYDAPTASSCRADEHAQIVDAIENRDIDGAQRLMMEHLAHIESSLNLEPEGDDVDLAAIFAD